MLPEEAAWIEAQLHRLGPARLSPLLNMGSGNRHFREHEQPFVGALWRSFEAAGGKVLHADLRAQDGVDLVGDFHDEAFQARLRALRPAAILASNLLEHVRDIPAMARTLEGMVPPGSYLVVTGPRVFPYHPDPIDNGLRATPEEAAALFPEMSVVAKAVVESPVRPGGPSQDPLGRRLFRKLYWTKEWVRSGDVRRMYRSRWQHRRRTPSAYAVVLRKAPA